MNFVTSLGLCQTYAHESAQATFDFQEEKHRKGTQDRVTSP